MIVALTTDFGDSPYAGALRGAILAVAPDAHVVDVTHAVPAHDVLQGALALAAAAPFFPEGTVHVCVVDPGVGTARRALVVEAAGATFLGPDNGVLLPAAERLGVARVRALDVPAYWRSTVSPVFHGRDVFGPVAGHLVLGVPCAALGRVVDDPVRLNFGRPAARADGSFDGVALAVDRFGNVVTNVPEDDALSRFRLGSSVLVTLGDRRLTVPLARTYGDVPPGETVVLVGSAGFLEIAMNRRSAAATFGVRAGDAVRVGPAG